jgi:hypothetical protein
MPHLCCAQGSRGVYVNCQAKAAANLDYPLLAPLWAAGLSFSKCHAERDVPNDPNLKGVFAGEEYARGVRLWTHGYDFYSNSRPWIGTYYGGEKGGKGGNWKQDQIHLSHQRMATLVKVPGSDQSPEAIAQLGKYNLGTKRTLEQYIEFTGINPITGENKAKCAVVYVPWYEPPPQEQAKVYMKPVASPTKPSKVSLRDAVASIDTELTQTGQIILGISLLSVVLFTIAVIRLDVKICGKSRRID